MRRITSLPFAFLFAFCQPFCASAEQSELSNLKVPAQFNWSSERQIEKGIAKGDPLIATWAAWTDFAISRNLDEAKPNANRIISAWNLGETKN